MRKSDPNQKPTFRIPRVNALVQEVLGPAIASCGMEIGAFVSISRVETSKDMKWVKVWVSVIGQTDTAAMKHLQKNIYDLQGALIRHMQSKIVPRIDLRLDTTPEFAAHITQVLDHLDDENK